MISREMSNKNTLNGLFKSNFELLLEKLPSDYTSSVSSYRNPNMAKRLIHFLSKDEKNNTIIAARNKKIICLDEK